MSKERLLVAKAAEQQITTAAGLLRNAVANLRALQHGAEPALDVARKAVMEADRAGALVELLIERIPT